MEQNIIEQILRQDLENISPGNLHTVENDLTLPQRGRQGSALRWKSGEMLFISDNGKVTRPAPGVGNREVTLTVTATLEGVSLTREFQATVLEERVKSKIIAALDLDCALTAERPCLPEYCVVERDDHSWSAARVEWREQPRADSVGQVISGRVADAGIPVTARIIAAAPVDACRQSAAEENPLIVRLTETSPWRRAADRMLSHLQRVDADRLLYNFRRAAGLDTGSTPPMTGWDAPECQLRGHTTGHALSALAMAWRASGIAALKSKADYLVHELAVCQQALVRRGCAPGFLSAWGEEPFDLLERFTPYPRIWAPYYTLDKIIAGLLDCYQYADNRQALTLAVGAGEWVMRRLTRLDRRTRSRMWSTYIAGEFGGMISTLARLAQLSGESKFIAAAALFINDKLYVPMLMNYDTLDGMHANQHIPQIIGAVDLYQATGNRDYLTLAGNFWRMIVDHHSYANGGVGETEMLQAADTQADFLSAKTAESCASYNMLKLTRRLYALAPDVDYMHYFDNVLHNHLLAAASPRRDGGTSYFMPLAPGSRKTFDTDANTCCHGTGLETLFCFQQDIFALRDGDIYINLFYSSSLRADRLAIEMQWQAGSHQLRCAVTAGRDCRLLIRHADWFSVATLEVNGRPAQPVIERGYLIFACPAGTLDIALQVRPLIRFRYAGASQTTAAIAWGQNLFALRSPAGQALRIAGSQLVERVTAGENFLPLNEITTEKYQLYFTLAE